MHEYRLDWNGPDHMFRGTLKEALPFAIIMCSSCMSRAGFATQICLEHFRKNPDATFEPKVLELKQKVIAKAQESPTLLTPDVSRRTIIMLYNHMMCCSSRPFYPFA